jgi:hypothetical protein
MYFKLDSVAIALMFLVCLDVALDKWPSIHQYPSVMEGHENLLEV